MTDYQYKTTPFAHQRDTFEQSRDEPWWALLMEQGTGKTKVTIDTAAYLEQQGRIDAMMVLAPNGVHRNWVSDELPIHLPEPTASRTGSLVWNVQKVATKWFKRAYMEMMEHQFAVLVMNYDALMTKAGAKAAKYFLTKRRVLLVFDESARVKSPSAKRTIRAVAMSKYAPYKRILTGTPATNGPFDLYSQLRCLEESIWRDELSIGRFAEFKTYFGIWEERRTKKDKKFPVCVAYKNIDKLTDILSRVGTRITKEEALDLPPKLYSKRYTTMTKDQEKHYESMRDQFTTWLDETPESELAAPLILSRLTRLQQIVCGFLPHPDGTGEVDVTGGTNRRINDLLELCETLERKTIIWCRFTRDVDNVVAALGDEAIFVDGRVTGTARDKATDAFKDKTGGPRYLVSKASALGEGYTFTAATNVVYYSNTFDLGQRLQSEDRCHRIGQEHAVTVYDMICPGTIDERMVDCMRRKFNVAQEITGDEVRSWI